MSNNQFNREKIIDNSGRQARYLRISVTDRCNFHCLYCRDSRRLDYIPHQNILRYEEIIKFVRIMSKMGIGKIRITGGEPFARKNCIAFLYDLRKKFPDIHLGITTNGSLLEPYLNDLVKIKPEAINISLDSFKAASYEKITGVNSLSSVLKNIEYLISKNLRVKLNAVALKGITNREADDFIYAIKNMPIDIRFIEFMPMGSSTLWSTEMFLETRDLINIFKEKIQLEPVEPETISQMAGPARMYAVKGAKGRFGFISALSDHFCAQCNRLRLTSDGNLRTCLFSDEEVPLAPLIRNPNISENEISQKIINSCKLKPLGEELLRAKKSNAVTQKGMTGIGG